MKRSKQQTITIAGLTVLALLLTAAGTIVRVRVALRPLARVVGTAAEVATLPLGRGDRTITTRGCTSAISTPGPRSDLSVTR